MSDNSQSASSPPMAAGRRRSSFAGQTFADLFGGPRSPPPNVGGSQPGPITQAAAQAQQRRLSLSTVGLSGSPNQGSSLLNRPRHDSSSSGSPSLDESAVEEGPDAMSTSATSQPASPFARRMSFGAQALRDARMRSTSGNNTASSPSGNGTAPSQSQPGRGSKSPPTAKGGRGTEGFNWSENMRARAERGSISGNSMFGGLTSPTATTNRSKSFTAPEAAPVREAPAPRAAPDHFQERILKGDFYMD